MDIEDVVNYAILVAVVVAFLLMVTGKFFDLSVERQTATESRATINLLQKIVTDGPFLVTDSGGDKMKLMVDMSKYTDPKIPDLTKCCDSVQYDYRFAVGEYSGTVNSGGDDVPLVDAKPPVRSNYDLQSPDAGLNMADACYSEFAIGASTGSEVPVNLCERNDPNTCTQGIAKIEVTDTPLSELSYWITQLCKSDYDASKRIPLAVSDFVTGSDLTIDNSKKTVCLHGMCKGFVCDQDVQYAYDSTLMRNKVSKFLGDLTCNFAVVSRENGQMLLYKGVGDVSVPKGATDMPEDHDAWTEKAPEAQFSAGSNNFGDQLSVSAGPVYGISVYKDANGKSIGSAYVALTNLKNTGTDQGHSIHDGTLTIDMSKVPGHETLDCGGTCVDMLARGLDKLVFKAAVYSGRSEGTTGQLTWKLYDSSGNCIQKSYTGTGEGKNKVYSDWNTYQIKYVPNDAADQTYGSCNSVTDFRGPSVPDKFPPTFDWKITRIQLSACETAVPGPFGPTCDVTGLVDNIKALMVDNLYFGVAGKEVV